jgi:hypothetical protein
MVATPKKRASKPSTLKVVGTSPEGDALLLGRTAASAPAFRVPLDVALVEALEQAQASRLAAARALDQLELPPPIPSRVESSLAVREIQNLLRQGRSAESIAKKAGVDATWVERWEGPIVWERAGTAARARRAFLTRSRGGSSRFPLGDAVVSNLKERGVKMDADTFEGAWDSTKKPRSEMWTVTFAFPQRGREHVAHWEFDPETDELAAIDKLGSELGWVAPIRRRKRA